MSVRVAPATVADLDAIAAIELHSFAHPRSRASFARELELAHARLDVARLRAHGPIVGFTNTWHLPDEVQLLIIAVGPDHRRAGLGRRLLDHVLGLAGAAAVTLEVRAGNAPALALYRGAGFAEVGRRRGYYPDGEDAVLMTKAGASSPHT